ncbi:arabinose-binding domain of AraC transcription regulator, N-term family protein [Pseudomonas aeruginosa]|nr:arabinose-binding domain of AraC transcription regulator, N-term family protein [Pseudomonas aeruginosa]
MQDDPSTSPLTHSATLRRLLYEALDALGLDPTRVYRSVYRRIPLPPPTLGGRLVHDNAPLFWTELAAVTGDADIGLHLGEAMKPRLLDVVGYLLLSARDLEEALRSFVRFQHILSGGFAARLEVEGDRHQLPGLCLAAPADRMPDAAVPQAAGADQRRRVRRRAHRVPPPSPAAAGRTPPVVRQAAAVLAAARCPGVFRRLAAASFAQRQSGHA